MISLQEATSNLRLKIPKHVMDIHKAFKKEGRKLYIVGGAVRDAILGKAPKDFDLATDAKPDEVLAIAKKYGFNSSEVGKAFGVVIVNGEEIATFRKDIGKGRRPDSVDYTDIKGDVQRRDLTINALFYDIERGEIVDLVGGIKDLKNKNIRTVGKAEERFDEDPLRKLRVLRFAGRIGGKIEAATQEALEGNPDISGVSPERVRDEFVKAVKTSKSTRWYLKKAHNLKILQQILPRIQYSTDFIDENDYILVISWLLRKKDPQNVYKYLKKLKYSHEEAYDIKFLLNLSHFEPKNVFRLKKMQENSSLTDTQLQKWGKLVKVDLKKFISFNLSVNGNDVMKMGFKGKEIGKQIEKMEKEKYLNEIYSTISKSEKRKGFWDSSFGKAYLNDYSTNGVQGAEYFLKDTAADADEYSDFLEIYNWIANEMGVRKVSNRTTVIGLKDLAKLIKKNEPVNENKVKGGVADGMSINDIAKHHKVPVEKIVKQLKMGIKVEMEHVDDPKMSAEIALDHLYEDPEYYTKLKTIEPKHENRYDRFNTSLNPKHFVIELPKSRHQSLYGRFFKGWTSVDPRKRRAMWTFDINEAKPYKSIKAAMKDLHALPLEKSAKSVTRVELVRDSVNELAYAGNMGFEEMMKFYDKASSKEIKTLEKLIAKGREKLAWKMVQNVTGTKLKGKEFENFVNEYPFMDKKHSHGVDDWGSLRDDDEMDLQEIAMGYPGKEDIRKLEKKLKRLRVKFNKEDSEREYGKSYANSHLREAPFPLKPGYEFVPSKSYKKIKKGKQYIVKDIKGSPGNFIILVQEKGDYNTIRIKARSLEEFYSKVLNVRELKELKLILTEGGAYGHMNHPFDADINLTFGQLKDIVDRALEGKLEMTTEKLDGQALAISWKNGRLIAARNKGHLKNKGEAALDINGVASKFQGRGEIEKAYNYAMRDLSNAVKALSDKQREKIFKEGACFMNLEVIYPPSSNVIPYGAPFLVFHGTMEYDDDGNPIGENKGAARILAGMIKQVEEDVQDTYTISGPPVVELPKEQDLSKQKSKYKSQIKKLQDEFRLKDNDGVAEYHQAWWKEWIEKNAPKTLDNRVLMGIVGRWAFEDRSFRLNNKNIEDEEVLAWAKKNDKSKLIKSTRKDNLMKFENIFLGLGAEVLNFTQSALVVSPDRATRKIKDDIEKTIKDVRKKGSEKQIDKLELELKRLNSIGGIENIVPIEGVVFQYKAKDTVYTLKLTGSFASANQLLGIFFGG